jgi:predicted O-methyltransferase YrrM
VRISELAILSALAAGCPEGASLFEIGTFDGRTTLNLALHSQPSCHVYTLDLPPDQATAFPVAPGERHMIDKPGSGRRYQRYQSTHPQTLSRIHQLYGDSATYDYSLHWETCGLVFVDGSHAYDYALADTRTALRLARRGGVIIWHDYGVWEGVTRALEEREITQHFGLKHIRGTSLVCWVKP